jgi:aminoglycoside phosphotransferase (APT) family kinase protein
MSSPETNFLDKPKAVRAGESLDEEKLLAYLREHLSEVAGPLAVEQFPSGYSNLTYLVRDSEREFVLRRPPAGANIKTAHDMAREYRILSHLYPVFPKVPRPLLYCEDETVMGAPFYLMERVRGVILRARPPAGLELSPDLMRKLSTAFIDNLVEIHSVDYERAGLAELGKPEGYVRRQIEGWTRRYENARTSEVAEIEQLTVWLAENQPADSVPASLIHNDYKYDNLLLAPLEPSRIVAVLDWEMATIGDPLMDLGTSLGYWVDRDDSAEWKQYGFGLTTLEGNMQRSQLLERYLERSGRRVEHTVFYYSYGLLKIAVIVQQIYRRYLQGFTKDERFAGMGALVLACGRQALRAIEKGRIDRLD